MLGELSSPARHTPAWVVRLFSGHRSAIAVLAALVGILCGLASVGFHYLIAGWSWLMTGYTDYTEHLYAPQRWTGWGSWFLILVPVISGLIYGPMITRWAPSARGHGIPEVMLAVRRKGGVIPGRVAVVKTLASALTIGGGGSAGREGPIVQVGASLGSWFATTLGLPKQTVILLAGCGSAAGIAATFNAPLAGALFAAELILISFTAETFGMVVIASVASAVTSHTFLGDQTVVAIPNNLQLAKASDMVLVAVVGIIGSLGGLAFTKMLYGVEDLVDYFYRLPEWLRPGIGGLFVGLILVALPHLYGSGYPVQLNILENGYTVAFILLLLLGRMLATSVTIAVGGSGGVFAPTLFVGACVGAAFGQLVAPLTSTSPATFGVIGMGAAFAGAARAPITGVLIIVEMTGQYDLILPIMLAVVLATGVSRFLTRKTIYTTKLLRRGDSLDDPVDATLMGRATARQLMVDPPALLKGDSELEETGSLLRASRTTAAPVVDPDTNRYLGCVTPLIVAQGRVEHKGQPVPISQLDLAPECVGPSDSAEKVLNTLMETSASGIPVVENQLVIGWISQRDMVSRIYRQQRRAVEEKEAETSWGARMQVRLRERRNQFSSHTRR